MIGVICQQEPRHWLGFDQHLAGSRLKMPLGSQGAWFCISRGSKVLEDYGEGTPITRALFPKIEICTE